MVSGGDVVVCGFDVEDGGANRVDSGGDDEDEGECGGECGGDGGDACAVGWLAAITCDVGFTIDESEKRRTVLSQKTFFLCWHWSRMIFKMNENLCLSVPLSQCSDGSLPGSRLEDATD